MDIAFEERESEITDKKDILLLMNLFRYSASVQPDVVVTLSPHDPDSSFMSTSPLGQTSLSYSRTTHHGNIDDHAIIDHEGNSSDKAAHSLTMIYDIPEVVDLRTAVEVLGECLRSAYRDIIKNYYSEAAMTNFHVTKACMWELEYILMNQMEERVKYTRGEYAERIQQLTKSLYSATPEASRCSRCCLTRSMVSFDMWTYTY